ncbi:MAG: hypothetical protein Q9163_001753 [Psora crenata]
MGNNVCVSEWTMVRTAVVLDLIDDDWRERQRNLDPSSWEPTTGAKGQAIVLNYLDPTAIEYLGQNFNLDPRFFQKHIAGSEEHFTGDWRPSSVKTAPYLRSARYESRFVSVDYRRPYAVPTGAVICICDPKIEDANRDVMLDNVVAAIKALPRGSRFDRTIVAGLGILFFEIIDLWNTVIFQMDYQISALEDQLEHDFWDRPQNPVSILHRTQRASRRLTAYRYQILSLEKDLVFVSGGDVSQELMLDLGDLKDKINDLINRADKAVPALLASIAIDEGAKASRLTAVALWFAPLSLAVSFVGVDGSSTFGGKKYWIMPCIAFPLLFLVMMMANSSDKLMTTLAKKKMGRSLISLFKPRTRTFH